MAHAGDDGCANAPDVCARCHCPREGGPTEPKWRKNNARPRGVGAVSTERKRHARTRSFASCEQRRPRVRGRRALAQTGPDAAECGSRSQARFRRIHLGRHRFTCSPFSPCLPPLDHGVCARATHADALRQKHWPALRSATCASWGWHLRFGGFVWSLQGKSEGRGKLGKRKRKGKGKEGVWTARGHAALRLFGLPFGERFSERHAALGRASTGARCARHVLCPDATHSGATAAHSQAQKVTTPPWQKRRALGAK